VTLPADRSPLSLLLMVPEGACEIYLNGRRYPGLRIRSWLEMTEDRPEIVPLPQGANQVEVALRFHGPVPFSDNYSPSFDIFLGSAAAIHDQAAAAQASSLLQYLPSGAINLAIFLAGLAMLGLFLAQRSSPDYFWLGICVAVMGRSLVLPRPAANRTTSLCSPSRSLPLRLCSPN